MFILNNVGWFKALKFCGSNFMRTNYTGSQGKIEFQISISESVYPAIHDKQDNIEESIKAKM